MGSDLAPQLARNSVYYAIKSVVALMAMLLVTPYILKAVGPVQYGVWALVGVMTSYAQLSDFGITESLVKYVAEYHASRDDVNLNRLVNTAFALLLFLAAVVGSSIILLLPVIIGDVLNIPKQLHGDVLVIFRYSIMIFLANLILGIFTTLIIGAQRMGYICSVNIASTFVGVAGTLFFTHAGWGLRGLVATNAIVALFTGTLNIYMAFRLFPELKLNFFKWVDRPMLGQIFAFSWKVQAASVSQLMIFQLDRILLSRYLGLEVVAYYEVGSAIAFYARTFLSALFAPIVPAVSALQAQNEHAMITGLYNRSFKFMTMLAVPFCLLVIALADPFIRMWMGGGFALSALTLQLLIPAYLVNVMTNPGAFVLNGINRPDVAMRSAITAGILNLLICFILVKAIGYFGLIIGITFSLAASTAYFLSMLHKVLPDIDLGVYRRAISKPLLFSIPAALSLYFLDSYRSLGSFAALIISSCVYGTVIIALLLKTKYLDDFEQRIFCGLFTTRQRQCQL